MESILGSIKKLLGIDPTYTQFDDEIIMHINSAIMVLSQVGLTEADNYAISGAEDTWANFIGARKDIEAIKVYIYMKTKLVFDPPQTGYLVEAMKKQVEELEWRLNIQTDTEV